MKSVLVCLIAAAMAMISIPPVSGEPLRIQTISLLPFGFIDEQGEATGLFYDIANLIAGNAELPHTNQIVPYARMVRSIETGAADVSISYLNITLKAHAHQVAPVMRIKNIIVGLRGSEFSSLVDAKDKHIAVVRHADYGRAFQTNTAIVKVVTNDYVQSLSMLLGGRVDGIAGAEMSIRQILTLMGHGPDVLGRPLTISHKTAWLHFSKKGEPRMMERLETSYEELVQNQSIERLISRYALD